MSGDDEKERSSAAAVAEVENVDDSNVINGDDQVEKTVDKIPDDKDKDGDDKEEEKKGDDSSSEHSSKDSVTTDESSFHASDYEDDAGYDPEKDISEMLNKAMSFKEEGNDYFKNGDFVRASRAYKKGASVLRPIHDEKKADEEMKSVLVVLQTNLSMCSLKQDKPKLSLDAAKKAIEVDNTNVKAYWRRAAAYRKMGQLKEAKKDLKEALKHDPNNGAVKKELHQLVKYMNEASKREKAAAEAFFSFNKKSLSLYQDKEEEKRKKEEEEKRKKQAEEEKLKKRKQDWEDDNVKRMATDKPALSFEEWDKMKKKEEKRARKAKRKEEERLQKEEEEKRRAAKRKEEKNVVIDDEEFSEKELQELRGYKKTSDGRTTSYFHREQSQAEKQLIGDITPQRLEAYGDSVSSGPVRLDSSATPNNISISGGNKGNPSAWNQAGTWEEKDATAWCSKQLKMRLTEATCQQDVLVAVVTNIPSFTGDASVAVAGGKKRYIFDFHCNVDFDIRNNDVDEIVASGSFQLPDINSGCAHELEINTFAWKKAPPPEYDESACQCRLAMIASIRKSVAAFVQDFNEHY